MGIQIITLKTKQPLALINRLKQKGTKKFESYLLYKRVKLLN